MKNRQQGFTLVEIAIVLVIIGLLLGGILKGQEMITQAKIKNVIADFSGIWRPTTATRTATAPFPATTRTPGRAGRQRHLRSRAAGMAWSRELITLPAPRSSLLALRKRASGGTICGAQGSFPATARSSLSMRSPA